MGKPYWNENSSRHWLCRCLLGVGVVSAVLVMARARDAARAQQNESAGSAQSRWDEVVGEAHRMKEAARRSFEAEMNKAVELKNRAIADMEKEMSRAKAKVSGSTAGDFDEAAAEARKIKEDAVARFDETLAEAGRLKERAAAKFEADLASAQKKAESLLREAEKDIKKGEKKVLSLSGADTPAKPTTVKKAVPPVAISLAKSGELAGSDLEKITHLPERIKQSRLSDQAIGLQEVPERPDTVFRIGDPFFGSGPISDGFEIPTGAVWQPQFFPFGTYSMAVQTFDDGNQQINEWVNSLDIFGNLNVTPTERLLIGFNLLEQNGNFTGYEFYPDKKSLDAVNGNVNVLFFEGRFDSLFPGLKSDTGNWASFDFAIGRQPVSYQSGILINDTFDSVGVTRVSLQNILGSVSTTLTGVYGFNHLNRGNNQRDNSALLFGGFSTLNYPDNKVEADMVVVVDTSSNPHHTLNLGFSSYQQFWGLVNTTFSLNQSLALNGSSPVSQNGTLFFAQANMQPPYTIDNVYLNLVGGINNFLSAARSPTAGGPLGQAGLLFAATGLGRFGPALPNDGQDMFGGSVGYQRYLGSIRRQIIFEFGGVTRDHTIAFGSQFEQAFGRHFVLTLNAFVNRADNRLRTVGYGARSVFTVNY